MRGTTLTLTCLFTDSGRFFNYIQLICCHVEFEYAMFFCFFFKMDHNNANFWIREMCDLEIVSTWVIFSFATEIHTRFNVGQVNVHNVYKKFKKKPEWSSCNEKLVSKF